RGLSHYPGRGARPPGGGFRRRHRHRDGVTAANDWRQKRRCEVAILDAHEIFSTLPQAGPPLVQTVQLLVRKIRDLPALAEVRRDRFHRRGVRYRQITEAAEPAKTGLNRIAVELGGGFHTNYIRVIKLKVL